MSKISVTTIAGLTSGGDANTVKIESGDDFVVDTNVLKVDASNNRVGIGTVNAPSNKNTVTPILNVSGSGVNGAAQITRHTSLGSGGALLHLSGTRGSDVNSYTIVQNNDGIGSVSFQGADGNEFVQGAVIQANVDGTPGDNDMPTRLGFFVTADGASSSTERMRIHNGGVVSFNNGIELGSGLDATAANVLDDYEEGEWTPTYVPANGAFGGSYLTQRGRYTKVGRKVFVEFQLVANFTNNTQSGNVQIGGLPFTATAHSGGGAYGSLTIAQSTRFTGAAPKAGQIYSGQTNIFIWTNLGVTGAGSDQTQLTTSNFILGGGNPNNIVASMVYLAD